MFNIYREEIHSRRYSYIFAVIIFISRNFTADQIPYAIREKDSKLSSACQFILLYYIIISHRRNATRNI